jgi:SSS family solute:Na+ symporter/sodium/proline symporter
MDQNFAYLAVIIIYIIIVFFISWWRSRGEQSQEDFMVAGRSAPAWLLVGSLICTWIGAGSLIGGGGRVYREGLSQLWMSAGAWAGIIVIYFLAARVRKISQFTVQDILEKRYHPYARVLGSIAVILGSTIIFSYQLRGVAFVIEYLFHVPQIWGIIITGILIFGFTVFAGLKSILAMDMLNGTLIILAVFIGLPIMLSLVGGDAGMASGVEHVTQTLPDKHFQMFGSHDIIWAFGVFFPTFFLLLGESSIYQKFYSAKSGGAVKGAVIGFFVGVVVVEVALAFFALTASTHPNVSVWRTSHDSYVDAVEAGANDAELNTRWARFADAIKAKGADVTRPADVDESLMLADRLYKNRTDSINLESAFNLPIWAGALLLAGGMAIVFSTGNSFMMAASTSFARDIYQRFLNKEADQKSMVAVQRIVMAVIVVFAVLILTVFTTVWSMALAAYTIIGCTLTPVILAAFLWKRVTPAAGVTSLALGILVWVVMVALIMTGTLPDFEYDYIIYPAGGASILSLIIVSFFTKQKPEEEIQEFLPKKKMKHAKTD